MVVASHTWQLTLPGCASLKEKRSIVRSLKDRLRTRFHLSVAETAFQDVLSRAELSVALVATGRSFAEEVLDKADRMVQENGRALIVGARRDFY